MDETQPEKWPPTNTDTRSHVTVYDVKDGKDVMAVKLLTRPKARKPVRALTFGQKLHALIEEQRGLAKRLANLREDMEDEEDHRAIVRAKKENAGKPGIPWAEAKKRLGLD